MKRIKLATRVIAMALFAPLASAGPAMATEKYRGFERGEALITAEELKGRIDAKDPKLALIAVIKPVSFNLGCIPASLNV